MLRGETKKRLDPVFYKSPLIDILKKSRFKIEKLILLSNGFKSGFGAGKQDQSDKKNGIIQIRPTNIDKFGNLIFDKNVYINQSNIPSKSHLLVKDDILFNNTNSQELVGKTSILLFNKILTFSNHITVIKADKKKVLPEYLWYILNYYQKEKVFYSICTNWNNQSGIGIELLKSIEIPLPSIPIQQKIVNKLNTAISVKQEKEKEAKSLLSSFEEYILKEFNIKLPSIRFVEQIIVNLQQLENALNVERYAISFDKSTLKWTTINSIGKVKLSTIAPSSELYKNNNFTLMRIDDLPNKPQKAEIRKVKGNQIAGNVQRVKEDDILVARLEPTIVNKKIVSVPKSQNDILASNEFIRLTCNEQNNPLFVKYMLQTDFYTQLMTSKTRGATPSRRRLSRIDFEYLPFPNIDKAIQDKIAFEFETRILKAMKLKKEAKENYNETKSKIENMIINKD